MTTTTLPKFTGKLPTFLEGDFGRAVLEDYMGRVKADYKDNYDLKVLTYQDGLVKGSNPFAVVLVNQIIRKQGLRTATQADLERILRTNALDLKGTYGRCENSALVLRSENEPNSYLAKNLAGKLKERLGKEYKLPLMINLCDLELENDAGSKNYGLAFRIREEARPIYASILSLSEEPNNILSSFSSEDIDEETGLPKRFGNGDRRLDNYSVVYNSYSREPCWTCGDGLCGLAFATMKDAFAKSGWRLNLFTDKELDRSGNAGRVVIVSGSSDLEKKQVNI